MKGVVFTTFADLVEEKFGLEMWETLLEKVNPPNGGSYTAGATYPDEELLAFVVELSAQTNIPVPDLVETFGIYMFPALAGKYPVFIQPGQTLKDFLKTIHDIIHVEVKKLYPDAGLPTLRYEDPANDQLVMLYSSPRRMCHLAVGLTKGAAQHFKKSINVNHPICMHQGADHCRLEITFND